MKLKLDVIKNWNTKYIKNYLEFSKLMETDSRSNKIVFLKTHATLEAKIGEFVIIRDSEYKVAGYCLLNYGEVNSNYKRISFFTVPLHRRKEGLGVQGMKKIIKGLIDKIEGCTLACEPRLNNFYEQAGLTFIKLDDENNTEHIMGLECNKNRTDLNIQPNIDEALVDGIYQQFDDIYKLSGMSL